MSSFQVTQLKVKTILHPESTGTLAIETVSFKNGLVTMPEAGNFAFGTTTGTKIGTAVTQKIGLWNVTPVVQPAGAAQAAVGTATQGTLTDNSGGTASTTLAAIAAAGTYDQADLTAIKNAVASFAAQLALVKADIAAIKTHQDATRTALVAVGVMKGAA